MAFFKRRKNQTVFSTSLPGLVGEGRRFYRALVGTHEASARLLSAQGVGGEATWRLVDTVATVHDNGVKRAASAVGPRLDVLDPEVQRAIGAALDQLAARFGLRGGLVQAWGVAGAFNEEFRARSRPGAAALWWRHEPVAFACILHPVGEGMPVVDGLLLFDHEQFEFTPSLDELPQAGWKKAQVRKAEKADHSSGVLYLDRSTGWARADVANRQNALPDDLFPQKKMWGTAGR